MSPKGVAGSGKKNLFAATVEVKCQCKRMINVRISEPTKSVRCWVCFRTITVNLYPGRGSVKATVEGTPAEHVEIIWQE